MGWGALQWLRATKESSYGIYDDEADAADVLWFRLVGANAFGMRAAPQKQIIRSADGGNRRRQVVASRKVVAGRLNTLFYPSQAEFLLSSALDLNSNDLASYTLDYFDTQQVQRFLGCKVGGLELQGTSEQDYLTAGIDWVGQSKGTTTLPAPADTVFPSEPPYVHVESKGLLTISGVMTSYNQLSISIKNVLASAWGADVWIDNLYYAGRDVDLSTRVQYLAPTLRTAYEAQSPLSVSAAWKRASGLQTTLNLQDLARPEGLEDDLPLDNAAYQTLSLQAFYSQTNSTDCSYTVA